MTACRCTSLKHPEHAHRICENLATESDGYCHICHAHVRGEKAAASPGPKVIANPSAR